MTTKAVDAAQITHATMLQQKKTFSAQEVSEQGRHELSVVAVLLPRPAVTPARLSRAGSVVERCQLSQSSAADDATCDARSAPDGRSEILQKPAPSGRCVSLIVT